MAQVKQRRNDPVSHSCPPSVVRADIAALLREAEAEAMDGFNLEWIFDRHDTLQERL
nr:hypothetical protein [uncultured Roseovarius sp.]